MKETDIIIEAATGHGNDASIKLPTGQTIPGVSRATVHVVAGKPVTAFLDFCPISLRNCHAKADLTYLVLLIFGLLNADEQCQMLDQLAGMATNPTPKDNGQAQ